MLKSFVSSISTFTHSPFIICNAMLQSSVHKKKHSKKLFSLFKKKIFCCAFCVKLCCEVFCLLVGIYAGITMPECRVSSVECRVSSVLLRFAYFMSITSHKFFLLFLISFGLFLTFILKKLYHTFGYIANFF